MRTSDIDTVSISGYRYHIKFKLLPKEYHDKTMIGVYRKDQYVMSTGISLKCSNELDFYMKFHSHLF